MPATHLGRVTPARQRVRRVVAEELSRSAEAVSWRHRVARAVASRCWTSCHARSRAARSASVRATSAGSATPRSPGARDTPFSVTTKPLPVARVRVVASSSSSPARSVLCRWRRAPTWAASSATVDTDATSRSPRRRAATEARPTHSPCRPAYAALVRLASDRSPAASRRSRPPVAESDPGSPEPVIGCLPGRAPSGIARRRRRPRHRRPPRRAGPVPARPPRPPGRAAHRRRGPPSRPGGAAARPHRRGGAPPAGRPRHRPPARAAASGRARRRGGRQDRRGGWPPRHCSEIRGTNRRVTHRRSGSQPRGDRVEREHNVVFRETPRRRGSNPTMHDALARSRDQLLTAAAQIVDADGGEPRGGLVARYFQHVASEDLCTKPADALAGMVRDHLRLAAERAEAHAAVHVYRPTLDADGWTSSNSIVQVVVDDMPFLVDSVAAAVSEGVTGVPGTGAGVHLVIHPVVTVRRDVRGTLEEILDGSRDEGSDARDDSVPFGQLRESWMTLEIDPVDDAEAARLAERVRAVLVDVRESVEDWPKMRQRALDVAAAIVADPPVAHPASEATDTATFLRWMADNHFTFLGYREYALTPDSDGDAMRAEQGTGLGLRRNDPTADRTTVRLSARASLKAREPRLLMITKANTRSTVHRPVHLDYVSVKRTDTAGNVVGEYRFIGLFTSTAYTESVLKIPIIADKVRGVLRRSGFTDDSHSGKDLVGILEDYPRDEIFQASEEHLSDVATAVLPLQERRTTKLFLRDDDFGRFVSCLVYLPRDHYNTAVRLRMAEVLRRAFGGSSVDYTTRVSESALSRLHFVVRMPAGTPIPDLTDEQVARLERRLVDAARTWDEKLQAAARDTYDEDQGAQLRMQYGKAFSTAYEQRFGMASTLADILHLEAVASDVDDLERTDLTLYKGDSPNGMRRFKLFRRRTISLTKVLPLFTHLGVEVVDEQPYEVTRTDGTQLHVYDFGLRVASENTWAQLPHEEMRQLFEGAFAAVWDGRAESDGFNALVLGAGLSWRQVVILRTVAKYLRQTRGTFSQDHLESTLVANGDIARLLVELWETRFDPSSYAGQASSVRDAAVEAVAGKVLAALDGVTSLDQDRIIRAFLAVIQAGLRTNYYQPDADGRPKSYVSLKLDPRAIPDLPAPRPKFEIWVYSPRVEGVHLRFGPVARGGLRWSDRREDFRTEVLGLVKAQMVKNAVIVPTGSKGGFFAKQLPDPTVDRDAWLAEGIASYKVFISGLLDLTDNRDGAQIVPPEQVVRHDGDDPYLVVAADKGTATFSDIANGVAQSYGFWLDDAFASGGSAGYDHKAMGITARGAWESVKRHFREMGVDTQTQDFTAVGVGDMSGDVFGNGMLLSEHIRLVAAFDHRHIFIDPTPDAAASFAERRRLFDLPRSSWDDYDRSLISAGGGVWPRAAKSIPLSPQARELLCTDAEALTPA